MSSVGLHLPRVLALLRKEKKISQKQVAEDLEISQALLSHYEKGIRNPNLDFIVRAADYYGVSCDYLLGRSPDRTGATLSLEDIPDPDEGGKGNQGVEGVLAQLNKKLLSNSYNILFDMLTQLGHKELTNEVSAYFTQSFYQMFRLVYSSNDNNKQEMFSVPSHIFSQLSNAAMEYSKAKIMAIVSNRPYGESEKLDSSKKVEVTSESMQEDYPLFAASLQNVVKNAEKTINLEEHDKDR